MDTQLRDALKAGGATIIDAVKIIYPTFTLRLATGLALIGGEQYLPEDPSYGSLSAVGELRDGEADQAPRLDITLLPNSAAAQTALTAPDTQGSVVIYMWGAINPLTGAVVGQCETPFIGTTDIYNNAIELNAWSVVVDCASGLDRALEANEGQRANDPFHQLCWPGEQGMDGVTGVANTIWWGMMPPRGGAGTTGSAGGGVINRWTGGVITGLQ